MAQGITGRALIAALALGAVVVVTRGGAAQAQTGGAPGSAGQPPPFVEPAEKQPARPTAEQAAQDKRAADKRAPEKAQAEKQPAPPPAAQPAPEPQRPPQPPPTGSAQSQPYAPYPYAPQAPYGQYPYPSYPPGSGSPPAPYAAPGYPPPARYPPQPSWPPPSAYPPPPSAYPPPPAYPPSAAYPPVPSAANPAPAYPPGSDPVPTLTGYAARPPTPSERPPVADPQGDRVILLPTATTHPQGTFYFSNYELIVFQGGYAFTDSTQVSVTAIPIPSESVTALDFSLKSSVYRGGLVRAAAIGSASGVVGKDVGIAFLGRAGAVVQVCLAQRCESSLSLSTNAVLIGTLLMVNGAGGIWRIGPHVSLLGELATMLPVGTAGGQFNGALLSGGVRLHYTHWGFDFSAMHLLDSSDGVATVPFFAMTYRP
jgi:hypothetical protein